MENLGKRTKMSNFLCVEQIKKTVLLDRFQTVLSTFSLSLFTIIGQVRVCIALPISFASNEEDNIDKASRKDGMIFSSDVNRRETNPIIYIKFWRQACLPYLLFDTEPFTLNASQLIKLEHCQQWFLKKHFSCTQLCT